MLNQCQSTAFQQMLGLLAEDLGPALVYTSMPHPDPGPLLTLEQGPAYDRSGVKSRITSWLRFLAAATARVARLPGRPLVLAVTNPPLLPHLAWAARGLRRCTYVPLIWDLYPDHIVRREMLGDGHPMIRLWRALNRRAFLRAAAVITIGDGMAEAIRAQLGSRAGDVPLHVIPNWADTDTIRPLPKADNPFARAHDQVDRVTVMYSGNIGGAHGLEALVDAASRLGEAPTPLSWLLIGDGLGRPDLAAAVAQRALPNVALLDYVPWDELPWSLATADVAVVAQEPGTEHLSVPSKTYFALAAGSAILALTTPDSDLARLVTQHDVGVVCPAGDPAAIAAAVQALTEDRDALQARRDRARAAAEQLYSARVVRQRFLDVLRPLVGRAP